MPLEICNVTFTGLDTFWRHRFGDDYLSPSCFGVSQCRQVCVIKVGYRKVGQTKQWIKV